MANKQKKSYTISVGKLNPAKLANFLEVECFVYVACVEGAIVVGDKVGAFFPLRFLWIIVIDSPSRLNFPFPLVMVYHKLTLFAHLGIFKTNHYALRTGDRVRCWTELDGRVCT